MNHLADVIDGDRHSASSLLDSEPRAAREIGEGRTYSEFLRSKSITDPSTGLDRVPELNSGLYPFCLLYTSPSPRDA